MWMMMRPDDWHWVASVWVSGFQFGWVASRLPLPVARSLWQNGIIRMTESTISTPRRRSSWHCQQQLHLNAKWVQVLLLLANWSGKGTGIRMVVGGWLAGENFKWALVMVVASGCCHSAASIRTRTLATLESCAPAVVSLLVALVATEVAAI